jgi:hypothetical protein
VIGDAFDERVEFDAEAFGLDDEVLDFIVEEVGAVGCGGWDSFSDYCPKTRLHFKEALGYKFADHFMRGVGVDFQILAEGANGRESLPGSHIAGEDGFLGCVYDLLVNG